MRRPQSRPHGPDTQQTSRGKLARLPHAPAGFTPTPLGGCGLRRSSPTRPGVTASYPVLVHRVAALLQASFRPRLAATPLPFASTSPPPGCAGDFHPQADEHARHTKTGASLRSAPATRGQPQPLGNCQQLTALFLNPEPSTLLFSPRTSAALRGESSPSSAAGTAGPSPPCVPGAALARASPRTCRSPAGGSRSSQRAPDQSRCRNRSTRRRAGGSRCCRSG